MNIRQAKEEIRHTVQAYLLKDENGAYRIPSIRQRPVLLMGPPGIGKTQIMEQIARECRIGLVSYTITHHTRQSAVGLPMIEHEEFNGKTYAVTEYTMSEIIASVYARIRDYGQKEGILFIDEINCVSETLTPAMLQFLQCKTFGNQAIPEGWIIVAAGNPPEYNKSVREFDVVTLDRVRYLNVEADLEVWRSYAAAQHIHGAVLSYLELRPKNFYRIENTVDGLQFVTARGWEDLSTLMQTYEELELPVTEEVVREFIRNEEVVEDFSAYLELYHKYEDDYRIDRILSGDVPSEIYARLLHADFDERLSVVNLLLDGLENGYSAVYWEKRITDRWYAFLKDYKSRLDSSAELSTDGRGIYEELLSEVEKDEQLRAESGYLTSDEKKAGQRLIAFIKENVPDAPDYFEHARSGFSMQTKALTEGKKALLEQTEHAFDFMEAAFSSGQELLVFVTGLTMRKEAAVFLAANPCERYFKYNEELLSDTKKGEILKKLEN